MIRKTVSNYKRRVKSYRGIRYMRSETHTEQVLRETWWLLFIPLYSRITIEKTML